MSADSIYTKEQCLLYASRLKCHTYNRIDYYQIPGRAGEWGLAISWEGRIYNYFTGKQRRWSKVNREARIKESPKTQWAVSYVNKDGTIPKILKTQAMGAVFVPNMEPDTHTIVRTNCIDDSHQLRPTDLFWSPNKWNENLYLIRFNGEERKVATLRQALRDICALLPNLVYDNKLYLKIYNRLTRYPNSVIELIPGASISLA